MSNSTSSLPIAYASIVPVGSPIEIPFEGNNDLDESWQNRLNSLNDKLSSTVVNDLTEEKINRLKSQGFTTGLAKALSSCCQSFPLRMWIIDNSGSMQATDGHKILSTTNRNDVNIVSCSRWEEIRICVNYHAELSGLLEAPTQFRLLNHPGVTVGSQQFGVAEMGSNMIAGEIQTVHNTMNKTRPGGGTPLTQHIKDIHTSVQAISQRFASEGKRVAIIIATDGLPTNAQGRGGAVENQNFVEALRLLEGLPVWIVIRLCTDDEDVVNFYNELDDQLELSMDVLDDFVGEAQEVFEHNKWLNYTLPIHRCREMGFHDRTFDMLDERALTKGELRDFFALLFGEEHFDEIPDPSMDWNGFTQGIGPLVKRECSQWCPMTKQMMPWINMTKLNAAYGGMSDKVEVVCCSLM